MKRREFSLGGLVTLTVFQSTSAVAQGGPVEGRDYLRLAQPLAMAGGPRVEVVEFFGYWCPHCNAFEPALDAWARKLPPEVNFRRLPVAFQGWHEPYQRLYFALEALNLVDNLHRKVFHAVHAENKKLDKDADMQAFLAANGVDAAKVLDTMKSFSVASKVRQAKNLAEGYRIDGVPTLGVQGRFTTSLGLAGSPERALQVTEALVQLARRG